MIAMIRSSRSSITVWSLIAGVAVWLLACDEDSTAPFDEPRFGTVEGTITLVPDDSLLAGLPLVLLDARDMSIVIGPDSTDESGAFRMEGVPVGRYYPIPLFQRDLQFDRGADAVTVLQDEVQHLHLRAFRSPLADLPGLTISGVVREAGSGAPLPGVLLTMSGGGADPIFRGLTYPWDTISDGAGRFVLRSVQEDCNARGCSGMTRSVMVTRAGYRSRSLRFAVPGPGLPDSLHVEFEMAFGSDGGAIRGRVLMEGLPQPGVPVALGWWQEGELLDKRAEKAPLMGFAAITDAGGWYRFEGVPAGQYTVSPAYLPDDGFHFWIERQLHARFTLVAGDRDTIPDLEVGPAIEPIFPARGQVVEVVDPLFRWTPVDGADSYRFKTINHPIAGLGVFTSEPELRLPHAFPNGLFVSWEILAYRDARVIGGFDQHYTFEVRVPPPD